VITLTIILKIRPKIKRIRIVFRTTNSEGWSKKARLMRIEVYLYIINIARSKTAREKRMFRISFKLGVIVTAIEIEKYNISQVLNSRKFNNENVSFAQSMILAGLSETCGKSEFAIPNALAIIKIKIEPTMNGESEIKI
jgi:hypothetical protein